MSAEEIERLLVRVEANAVQFENQMKRINRSLHGTTGEVRKMRQQFKREMQDLGRDVYVPVQAASALALGAITAFSYQAAKRAEAVDGAFATTFASMPDRAKEATKAVSDEFQRLETDVKDNFTQMQSVLTALGVGAEQSLAIVDSLQRRSLDISAFKDISDAQAFQAVISGITGETEPLKRLGIVVNEAAVKAKLLELGFKGNATQASESAKAIARANIILERSAQMHGQVAREADTTAEAEKRARKEFVEAAEALGKKFLPVATEVLEWAVQALEKFNALPDGVQMAGLALLALVAASGPIATTIKGLQALIRAATAARLALAAVGGSSVVGGAAAGAAAGGAAGGAAAGGVLGTAATGAAVLVGTASFAPAPERPRDYLDRRWGESDAEWRARGGRMPNEMAQDRRRAETGVRRKSINDTIADDPTMGDFGLSEAQRQAVGGGSGGGRGGRGGSSRTTEAREALALERAIAVARASGDEAAIKAAERRETLAGLVEQYTSAGYGDAQAQAESHLALLDQATRLTEEREKAEEEVDLILRGRERQLEREAEYQRLMNDQLMDQLSMAAELARLSGDEGALRDLEKRLWVEDRINQLMQLRLALNEEDARTQAEGQYDQMRAADIRGGLSSSRDENAVKIREEELEELADLEEQGLLDYQEIMERRAQIDADYRERRMTGEGTMLDQIAALSNSSIKEIAAIGKAAAIAQATIDGYSAIQKAWASAPFPANLPGVAITTAATAANVAAIAGVGFERGGYTGDGGTKQIAGVVHGQEYVFDAQATRRIGVANLEAMRNGSAMLDGVGRAAATIPGRVGDGGTTVHFSPSIDARGADRDAVRRIERVLTEQVESFASNVRGVMAKKERYRLGTRRP